MGKILITGVAGFIGSHIAEKALQQGEQLIGIDHLENRKLFLIKKFNISLLRKYKNFNFIQGDILNTKLIFKLLKQHYPEFVVHCAAKTNVRKSFRNPLQYIKTNVLGSQILLEGIKLYSPNTKTVLISSSSVYGRQKSLPFSETAVLNPQSPYAISKYLMESVAKYYYDRHRMPLVIVRAFSIYGPRGRVDMAPFLITKAAETGKSFVKYGSNIDNQRDWTYVDDFVNGVLILIRKFSFSSFEILNFGRSQPIGIDDFVNLGKKIIKKYLNINLKVKEQPLPSEEMPITFADIKKAKQLIGYNPQTQFKDGIEKFIKYYKANRTVYNTFKP